MAGAERRRGRTPSINRKLIERAVREVGANGEVTMHGVASELGVNVTTLYRHTGGLDALLQMHASNVSTRLPPMPATAGQSWQDWLRSLAEFYRTAFLETPDLLQYAQAALDPDFERLEQATKTLVEYGFSPREAARAHAFLVNTVVGYVHQELQTRAEIAGGSTPTYASLAETLRSDASSLPTLSSLSLDDDDFDLDTNFRYFVNYTIDGIAARTRTSRADKLR
ncbi:MAG: TetR/AcrR family transcriptional regulator C-terminal domain-containing protein [Gammaproteobacteria bacterium]|nr:TetR/AcrR family transcriptional regulator C-terminal domain-containing protein [Gammaproteobacteria bacterium]MDH3371897.1 TetR/AcrR family transcriptional regulator C-terminal domain-containing protein [Gammaproteobacteria bacterium]MDH3551107.1 TetR/AcrR family transcriptional regulator C-terminal domain-containing protein [Gammaproteobacteria bacterium]